MMQEKIFFKNNSKEKEIGLCGILSNPTLNKKGPMIILCHGFTTSKDSHTCVRLEEILNLYGISTFRFDFFGHGESMGKFENITISGAVDNILTVISFLKKRGYKKIGLVGSSFGGLASIIAASQTRDLFLLALKSPVSDYGEIMAITKTREELEEWKIRGYAYYTSVGGRSFRLNYTFFEDFKNNDGYVASKSIRNLPCLIVHGDRDERVPIEQSIKLAGIMENCKLEIIKGAAHRYTRPGDFEKMLGLISKFIIEHS